MEKVIVCKVCGKDFISNNKGFGCCSAKCGYKLHHYKGRLYPHNCKTCNSFFQTTSTHDDFCDNCLNGVLDKDFFKKWTPEMAYILGFFAADGSLFRCNSSSYYMSLFSTDLDIVEKMAIVLMGNTERIQLATKKDSKSLQLYFIKFRNQTLIRPLLEMGFCLRKTYNLKDLKIHPDYFWHFFRGFMDGDGWIGLQHGNMLCISYIMKSKPFGDWMWAEINKRVYNGSESLQETKLKAHRATYGGKTAEKICELMYKESTIHMDRKYKKYQEIINSSHYSKMNKQLETRNRIKELMAKGLTIKEIQKELGLRDSTVRYWYDSVYRDRVIQKSLIKWQKGRKKNE